MKIKMPQFNGVYDTMEFPPYQYQEFPKIIQAPDGSRVTVANHRELLEVMQRPASPEAAPDETAVELGKAVAAKADLEQQVRDLQAQLAALAEAKPEVEPEAKLILDAGTAKPAKRSP